MKYIFLLVFSFFISNLSFAEKPTSICTTLNKVISQGSASQKLNRFFKEQWKYTMVEFPLWATAIGYPGQNDRLTDMSLTAIQRREKENICQLAALKKIPYQKLSSEDKINFDLLKRDLELSIEGQQFGDKYLELSQLGGLHMKVADIVNDMPTANVKDYKNILSRLDKVPELEEQIQTLLREGLLRKITAVKMLLQAVPAQFDFVLTAKIEDSPLFKPFKDILSSDISEPERAQLRASAKQIIEQKVYPALKKFKDFVVNTYIPGARETMALSDAPNGKAWYDYKVKYSTTTHQTPEELHQIGLHEVSRLTEAMDTIRKQVKFKGNRSSFHHDLMTNQQFFFSKKEDLLAAFRDIAKRLDPELMRQFKTLPRLTYGVCEMPDYKAKNSPAAYYNTGHLDAARPGYFTANTYDLKRSPKWGMESLTMHEAVPGHHLQIALAQEMKDLPDFRKYGGHTAFMEGWALYAEGLGQEMGFYKDPYSQYGQLSNEIWRAIRLVVDTGLHSKGWSRQQAIDYFLDHMPISPAAAEVEVDRYIAWPGQALGYKVGQLKILELRQQARQALGDNFDIREFHDQILAHGSLPIDILEKIIQEWISQQKMMSKKKASHLAS